MCFKLAHCVSEQTLTCTLLSEQAQLQDYLDHELAEEEALLEAANRHEQDEV